MAQRYNGATAQKQVGWRREKGIATPSFVGLAMTIHMIKLEVIARIPMDTTLYPWRKREIGRRSNLNGLQDSFLVDTYWGGNHLFVFFQDIFDIIGCNPSIGFIANKHNRCKTACTNASQTG
jgi:hypothetical protein